MSNTCPVCFELFLPPDNQPFILFPCGHTFCKVCINAYAKQKKKCPFCRTAISSMAPNISLQNLILSANEKKEEVIKRLRAKQEQMLKNNSFSADRMPMASAGAMVMGKIGIDPSEADKYINDFRLLDIRCGVLEEEKQDYSQQLASTKSKMKALD